MSTTVPQNIKGTNIMGTHLPTRNSLRHSRMLVGNKTYQGKYVFSCCLYTRPLSDIFDQSLFRSFSIFVFYENFSAYTLMINTL